MLQKLAFKLVLVVHCVWLNTAKFIIHTMVFIKIMDTNGKCSCTWVQEIQFPFTGDRTVRGTPEVSILAEIW